MFFSQGTTNEPKHCVTPLFFYFFIFLFVRAPVRSGASKGSYMVKYLWAFYLSDVLVLVRRIHLTKNCKSFRCLAFEFSTLSLWMTSRNKLLCFEWKITRAVASFHVVCSQTIASARRWTVNRLDSMRVLYPNRRGI